MLARGPLGSRRWEPDVRVWLPWSSAPPRPAPSYQRTRPRPSKHLSAQPLCCQGIARASQRWGFCSQGSCSKPFSFLPLCLFFFFPPPSFLCLKPPLSPTFSASFHSSLNTHVQCQLFHRGLISPLALEKDISLTLFHRWEK